MAGNPEYPFKNESQQPMIVMMDHEREVKRVDTGAAVIFEGANIGDNRTFDVFTVNNDGSRGGEIYADSFNMIRAFHLPGGRDLRWSGSKIED
jgi:hypothetical protein